jgi:hypothetical protein
MMISRGGSVVVVVLLGSTEGSVVEVVVVSPGARVVVTTTVGATVMVTVASESCVELVWASSVGQNNSGEQRTITTRATPTALSVLRTDITSSGPGTLLHPAIC